MNTDDIIDAVKVGVMTAPPAVTFFGVGLEDWMYMVSITAGLLLIIERIPKAWSTLKGKYGKSKHKD